jgi:protein involved in polysaccharide export with SLBB domain
MDTNNLVLKRKIFNRGLWGLIRLLSVGSVVLALAGCAVTTHGKHRGALRDIGTAPGSRVTGEPKRIKEYTIQPGDQLDIKFFYNPELNETALVRPDGRISLQLIDDMVVAGLTPSQVDDYLTKAYSNEVMDPSVTVILRTPNEQLQQIYVGGEVTHPGLVKFAPGMTPLQAVIQASGFLDTAMLDEVILIRKGEKGQPVPYKLNLEKAIYGQTASTSFALQPQDIVYVAKSPIAELNKFVRQYIQDVFLFNGSSVGMFYQLPIGQGGQ